MLGHRGRFGCIGKKYWYHKWHDTSLISNDRKTVLISQLYLLNHCRLPEADSIACVEELLGSLNCLWMILPFQDKVEPRYSSFTEVCRPSRQTRVRNAQCADIHHWPYYKQHCRLVAQGNISQSKWIMHVFIKRNRTSLSSKVKVTTYEKMVYSQTF